MSLKRITIVMLTVLAVGASPTQAKSAGSVAPELERVKRLSGIYADAGQSHQKRAQVLEEIIGAYQDLLEREGGASRTVGEILEGEIEWRLALAESLLLERTRQSRFAVEELGLGGVWAEDLSKTLDRAKLLLSQTNQRLEQLTSHMRKDADVERKYVVTGLFRRAERAKVRLGYYQGWAAYCRALVSGQAERRRQLLESAIEYLRPCCTGGGDKLGTEVEQTLLQERAVLLMCKALRLANRLADADKLLSWLEGRKLSEQLAYESGLQRCRLLRDQGYFETALAGLGQVRRWCAQNKTMVDLSVQLSLAWLECTIQAGWAKRAAGRNDLAGARLHSRKRLKGLVEIFRSESSEQVRVIICEQVRVSRLDGTYRIKPAGLELLAVGMGLAEQEKCEAALKVFDELFARDDSANRELHDEALWQAGQAARQVSGLRACAYLGRLADEFSDSPRAWQGVILAVGVSARLREDKPKDVAVEQACFVAMQRLMERYPTSKQAKQWRFYWADLLSGRGRLTEAAKLFGQIGKDDPRFVQARYHQLDCQRQLLDKLAGEVDPDRAAKLAGLAKDFLELDRYVRQAGALSEQVDKESREYGARSRLAAVRILCTQLNEPQAALLQLGTFAGDYADQPELQQAALRYRAVALLSIGRLGQAAEVTVELMGQGSAEAEQMAGSVLPQIAEKLAGLQPGELSANDDELAKGWVQLSRASLAIVQKSQITAKQKVLEVAAGREMLGRALLAAGELDEALAVFTELERISPNSAEYIRMSGRALLARREYEKAGQKWARLIRGLQIKSPEWFEAWYWALRTNFEAGGDREQIARRIKQLRGLDEGWGSKENVARYETLLNKLNGATSLAK